MRRYRYSYHTVVSYDSMVTQHHFQIRSTPRSDSHQKVLAQVIDHLTQLTIVSSEDCFGNPIHYGVMEYPHDLFVAASQGVVECESYRVVESCPTPIYRMPTKMTQMNEALSHFAQGINLPEGQGAKESSLVIADAIYSTVNYQGGVTTTETTAAQSFDLGAGVCQDFAHILIAICRNFGIFARYCVGFLVGTGETHAWVEVYGEDGAWWGIDPTHNRLIEYDYIKIAHGRDAADCSVIRGVHRGGAAHTTQIRVVVEPL